MRVFAPVAGVAVGIAIAVQSVFNAVLARAIGLWPAILVVHLTGAVTVVVLIGLFLQDSHWEVWRAVPGYVYLGGVIGAFIVGGIAFLVTRIGVTAALSVIIAAQLVAAVGFDHFGLFGVSLRPVTGLRLLGVGLLIVGARLALR